MIFVVVQSMNKCSSVSSSAAHKIRSISPICFLFCSSRGVKVEPLRPEPNPEPRISLCQGLMDLRGNPWARIWPKWCFCPKPICWALDTFSSTKMCKPDHKRKKKKHGTTTDNGKTVKVSLFMYSFY